MWISHLEQCAMLSLCGGKNALLSSEENAYIPSAWAIHHIGSCCLFYYTTRVGTWWLKTTLVGTIESTGKSMSNYWTGFEGNWTWSLVWISRRRYRSKTSCSLEGKKQENRSMLQLSCWTWHYQKADWDVVFGLVFVNCQKRHIVAL